MAGIATLAWGSSRLPRSSGHFDFPVSFVFVIFVIIVVVFWAVYLKPRKR
jgi:hypothetical protein